MSFSDYFVSLTGENKKRFIDKMETINGTDPYTLKFTKNTKSIVSHFPKIYRSDLCDYLINRESPFTLQSFRAVKSLTAYKNFENGWVSDLMWKKYTDNTLVLGQVCGI